MEEKKDLLLKKKISQEVEIIVNSKINTDVKEEKSPKTIGHDKDTKEFGNYDAQCGC